MRTCERCGTELPEQTGRGRRRKYCDGCREREDCLATPQVCQHCESTFFDVRKRNYCLADDCKRSRELAKGRKRPHNGRRPRICEVCTSEYRPTYPDQRTCGRACGAILQTRNDLERLADGDRASDVPWASCVVCQAQYIARGRRKRHCDPPKPDPWILQCQECGKDFSDGNRRKYCKDKCAKRAHRRHQRHKDRIALASLPHSDGRTQRPTRDTYTQCQECGGGLTGRRLKWCSDACGKRANDRHDRHLARTAPNADRSASVFTTWQIAERDGWQCHICHRRVASLDVASMDHLVPVEDGGLHVPIQRFTSASSLQLATR